MKHTKTALIWTCLLTVATVILRIVSVVRYTDETRDVFGYVLAVVLLLAAGLFILAVRKFRQSPERPVGKRAVLVAFLCLVSGAALALGYLIELIKLIFADPYRGGYGASENGSLTVLVVLVCVTGLLGGAYLIFAGVTWLNKKACEPLPFKYASLLPVLWGWMRLAHYTVSYASASGLKETVYDYGFLIFTLLFLMNFAYFCAGHKEVSLASLMMTALPSVWFGMAGLFSTAILATLPEGAIQQAVHAGNLAQWMDLPLLVLAFILVAHNSAAAPLSLKPLAETESPAEEKAAVETEPQTEPEVDTEDDEDLILPEVNEVIPTFTRVSEEEKSELESLLEEFSEKS